MLYLKEMLWQGNRKWYVIGITVAVIGLMLYFGDNTAWVAE